VRKLPGCLGAFGVDEPKATGRFPGRAFMKRASRPDHTRGLIQKIQMRGHMMLANFYGTISYILQQYGEQGHRRLPSLIG
jgi:hypothetical protein